MTLASGMSDLPDCGPPVNLSVHLAGSVHKSRVDNVVCMWVKLQK